MKLVITGANGLIGRHFIKHLSGEYEIIALTREKESLKVHEEQITWKSTDYTVESLVDIFSDANAVLHLASVRPYANGNTYMDNINLDMNVFKASTVVNLKNIVYISSRSVYGNQITPWVETMEVSPESDYSLAKSTSEITANYFNRKYGLKIKIIRLAQVFTHDEYKGSLLNTFFSNASMNKPLVVSVEGVLREYIYIKDVVDALNCIIQNKNVFGTFNLGSEELVDIRYLGEIISEAFGKKELLTIDKNKQYTNSTSLMSSRKLYNTFGWSKAFTLREAAKDIYLNYYSV